MLSILPVIIWTFYHLIDWLDYLRVTFTVLQATRHNIKSYVLPVGGAVILGVVGALVGGPVGFVAGANIGAAAALTGKECL